LNCLIELHYLPSIAWFAATQSFDTIVLERHEHFIKQSYRSRCRILTSQGVQDLTVSAYNNAPFFEYYSDALHDSLYKEHTFLYDLNLELLTICRGWLKLPNAITETMAYEKIPQDGTANLRNLVNAKKPAGYEKYFQPIKYTQVFGHTFAENMSIIDLIFCEGPNARQVISRPRTE
jgi:hypothetical protein